MSPVELAALRRRRARLLAKASGVVVDLGGGTGEHLDLYRPQLVERVIVCEPDPAVRSAVARRVEALRGVLAVELDDRPLASLGLVPATIDTVVGSFCLCGAADPATLAASITRLLAPGGRFLGCEHVPGNRWRRTALAAWKPAWRSVTAGCRLDTDPLAVLASAGLTVIDLERFTLPTLQLPLRSCVAVTARPGLSVPS